MEREEVEMMHHMMPGYHQVKLTLLIESLFILKSKLSLNKCFNKFVNIKKKNIKY